MDTSSPNKVFSGAESVTEEIIPPAWMKSQTMKTNYIEMMRKRQARKAKLQPKHEEPPLPPPVCSRFISLPPELQNLVWEHAVPDQEVITLRYGAHWKIIATKWIPGIFSACRASRCAALKSANKKNDIGMLHGIRKHFRYCDLERDTIRVKNIGILLDLITPKHPEPPGFYERGINNLLLEWMLRRCPCKFQQEFLRIIPQHVQEERPPISHRVRNLEIEASGNHMEPENCKTIAAYCLKGVKVVKVRSEWWRMLYRFDGEGNEWPRLCKCQGSRSGNNPAAPATGGGPVMQNWI